MAQTVLYYLSQQGMVESLGIDYILMIQSTITLDFHRFRRIMHAQLVPPVATHHILMGQLRDKAEPPYEFRSSYDIRNESFFSKNYDSIHLYLGSDCFLLSSNLIPGIIQQARSPDARVYMEQHLGHDLSTLAYMIPETALHWIPILRDQEFWSLNSSFNASLSE